MQLRLALFLLMISTFAVAHDDEDGHISKINGSIHATAGKTYGDLDTVNGGIEVDANAVADDVETVNGGISLGNGAKVKSASTVNGGIEAGENVQVQGNVETVNGGIRITFRSRVGGDVSTVNGRIVVQSTEIGGQVRTARGDITIGNGSHVRGGIWVEKSKHWGWKTGKNKKPLIIIGPNAVVDGDLVFDQEVDLFVHTTAKIGRVSGAKAQSYNGSIPPRD